MNFDTLQHYIRQGIYYGYPECCIQEFIQDVYVQKINYCKIKKLHEKCPILHTVFKKSIAPTLVRSTKRSNASNSTGFVPCEYHATLILEKKMELKDLIQNRKHFKKFPHNRTKKSNTHKVKFEVSNFDEIHQKNEQSKSSCSQSS